jgi:SAM-dependent methyltransferase
VVSFICNICGEHNRVERFASEPASCACGSNVRTRALIHLLSMELFGESLVLKEFPRLRSIRGLGMSDHEQYAALLADKFDYTNTYYDREPRLDFTQPHPELHGAYDFILSADVLEHIAPPVGHALAEACRLLKPTGFLGVTVFCNAGDIMREHFPDLHQYRVVRLGDSMVLVNRRTDGKVEVLENGLIFHAGSGETLEMREYGITQLEAGLKEAGFREVHFLSDDVPLIGVLFDGDVSQPLIARKEPFLMNAAARREMIGIWRRADGAAWEQRERADRLEEQIRLASESRWLRLGRKLGVGPKFS